MHNGEILSYDEVVASGDFLVVGAFVYAAEGVELNTVNGVFTYQGQRYHSGQLETVDGVRFIDHPDFGRIPVGITTGKAAQLLASINDLDVPEAAIETFLAVLTAGAIEADEWAEILGRGQFEECFGPEAPIDMWPLDLEFAPDPYKQYDQDAVQAKIWKKPIELIEVGDYVVSHDKDGNLVPGYVPRTFQNEARILLNFHGTRVTSGHVYYRADSKRAQKFETLINVLRDDGVIQHQDGTLIRAATNVSVDSPRDGFVVAVTGTRQADGSVAIKEQGRIRLGTRFVVDGTRSYAVADLIEAAGGLVEDEMIRVGDGSAMPFHWEFGETLPKPEDFVLACSNTTIRDIYYKAAEWEDQAPRLPAPMVLEGGPVRPLIGADHAMMPRNEPLDVRPPETAQAAQDQGGAADE